MGLARAEVFVPQSYRWGQEGQVDWYARRLELRPRSIARAASRPPGSRRCRGKSRRTGLLTGPLYLLASARTLGGADWRAENGEIVGTPKTPEGGWLILDKFLQDVQSGTKFLFAPARGSSRNIPATIAIRFKITR